MRLAILRHLRYAVRITSSGIIAVVIGCLQLSSVPAVAEENGALKPVTLPEPPQTTDPLFIVKPDQYNPTSCRKYIEKIKPGWKLAFTGKDQSKYQDAEDYVTGALCDALPVDFELRSKTLFAEDDDRTKDDKRTLPAEFIRALVESNEFDTPGYEGISISGAIISGDLILSKIKINNALLLKSVTFQGGLDLSYSSTEHNLEISGFLPRNTGLCLRGFQSTRSVFIHDLRQQPVNFDSKVTCDEKVISSIDLPGARIGGELNISDAVIRSVNAVGVQVAGQVQIRESDFYDRANPDINFQGASTGALVMRGINSRPALEAQTVEGCLEHIVVLDEINIAGYAQFVRSSFCAISMTGARIAKNLDLLGLTLGSFDFTGSTADGDFQIAPSLPPDPSRGSGRLPNWLRHDYDQPTPTFRAYKPNLVLNHSSVALLRVARNNWPDQEPGFNFHVASCELPGAIRSPSQLGLWAEIRTMLSMLWELAQTPWEWAVGRPPTAEKYPTIVADFRFKSFAKPSFCAFENRTEYRLDSISNPIKLNETEIEGWLGSTQYSPAEYQLMYDLLISNGQSSDARRIGYVGKMLESYEFRRAYGSGSLISIPVFILSSLPRWFIGYGYYSYLAIFWAALFCILGAVVFARVSPASVLISDATVYSSIHLGLRRYLLGTFGIIKKNNLDYGLISPFGYSFDTLLPLVKLRELHYEIEISGRQRYYFYIHKIFGWMLGIFVLGAFSGLIK
jgi:hypothetical protein